MAKCVFKKNQNIKCNKKQTNKQKTQPKLYHHFFFLPHFSIITASLLHVLPTCVLLHFPLSDPQMFYERTFETVPQQFVRRTKEAPQKMTEEERRGNSLLTLFKAFINQNHTFLNPHTQHQSELIPRNMFQEYNNNKKNIWQTEFYSHLLTVSQYPRHGTDKYIAHWEH